MKNVLNAIRKCIVLPVAINKTPVRFNHPNTKDNSRRMLDVLCERRAHRVVRQRDWMKWNEWLEEKLISFELGDVLLHTVCSLHFTDTTSTSTITHQPNAESEWEKEKKPFKVLSSPLDAHTHTFCFCSIVIAATVFLRSFSFFLFAILLISLSYFFCGKAAL